MHTGLETDDVTHIMLVHYERQTCVASSDNGKIFVLLKALVCSVCNE